jgi:hypothetical protein
MSYLVGSLACFVVGASDAWLLYLDGLGAVTAVLHHLSPQPVKFPSNGWRSHTAHHM